MGKRLRGWALEKEQADFLQPPSTSSSSSQDSALATKLLSLWSHGQLSALTIREIAHLAVLDGANHPELAKLAKAGNFGEVPGNVHRDIVTNFCKTILIAEPFLLDVPCIDPKSSAEEDVTAAMFLPHMMFANLGLHYSDKFNEMFATEKLSDFWTNALATEDDRFFGHPMLGHHDWKEKCIH